MELRCLTKLLSGTAAGSLLLLSSSTFAGRMFPDEPQRPHIHAGLQPNWGYNPTCWQRFPPVPACNGGAGCHTDTGSFTPSAEYSADIYTPQTSMDFPQPSYQATPGPGPFHPHDLSPAPGLTIPYAPPQQSLSVPQEGVSQPPLSIPFGSYDSGAIQSHSPVAPPSTFSPPPAFSQPGNSTPSGSPPVQIFRASPPSTPPLPPLPAPPTPVPPVPPIPAQTQRIPDQLQIGANGRVAVVPTSSDSAASRTASTRYGIRFAGPAPQTLVQPNGPVQSGVRIQFADAAKAEPSTGSSRYGTRSASTAETTRPAPVSSDFQPQTTFPVRAISQSRPLDGASTSARYGTVRPGSLQTPAGTNQLEPLQTTPVVPYQR